MLLFSIVGNRLSLFLVVAVLALLGGNNVAMAFVSYDTGMTEIIEPITGEGVRVTPSPAPDSMPTTGLLLPDTTVRNEIPTQLSGIGIFVLDGSKLIAYGGDVSSPTNFALVLEGSSAAICDGIFTGGADSDGDGRSAVVLSDAEDDPAAIRIEIKTGTFTGADGTTMFGGDGLEIEGSTSTGITLGGIFQGGDGGTDIDAVSFFAGCGLRVTDGANMELHGGQFLTGDGIDPCSILASSGATIDVFRGTFDGSWRSSGTGVTFVVHGTGFELDGEALDEGVPKVGESGLLTGVLCDDTPISVELVQSSFGTLIFRRDCRDPEPIEDCKSSKSSKSKSSKSPTAKSSKTAKSGNGTTGSAKGSKSGKMSSKASSTMLMNGENVFYHANGQVDEGFAMIGANAMGTSSSPSSSLFSFAGALKITTSFSALAMMAFYAY